MLPRPPRSTRTDTLFPYTTLFRSNHPRMMAALYDAKRRGASVLAINPLRERCFSHFSDPKNVGELLRDQGIAVADEIYQVQIGGDLAALKGDRQSTRLNSSH